MIDNTMWSRLMPPYIITNNQVANISLVKSEGVADVTNELAFTIGRKVIDIFYPKSDSDGRMIIGGQTYVGITKLVRPPITNIGLGRDRHVNVNNPFGRDIEVFVLRSNKVPTCKWGARFYYRAIPSFALPLFTRFPIRPVDRVWMNRALSTNIDTPYITPTDLQGCYNLFAGSSEWQWKNINDLRWLSIEEAFLYYIMNKLHWLSYPNIDNDMARRSIGLFWVGNPQIQWMDPNSSELAKMALTQKVHIPIGHFDPLEYLLPDESWVGVFDVMTTPQSEKAGTVVSLTDKYRRI